MTTGIAGVASGDKKEVMHAVVQSINGPIGFTFIEMLSIMYSG